MVTIIIGTDNEQGDVLFAMDMVHAERDDKGGVTIAFTDEVSGAKTSVWLDSHLLEQIALIKQQGIGGAVEVFDPKRFDNPFAG